MFRRQELNEIPTTSVALDLLTRVGSPTRYSLSPYRGMRDLAADQKYQGINDGGAVAARFIRSKDDFTFIRDEFVYSTYDREWNAVEEGYLEEDVFDARYPEIQEEYKAYPWKVTSTMPPTYSRRFEDGIPPKNMRSFLAHVLHNAVKNNGGWEDYCNSQKVTTVYEDEEGLVSEADLLTDGDEESTVFDSTVIQLKRELAYCLYRMLLLSSRCHVNILSLVLAYNRMRGTSKSAIPDKPAELIANGPIYAADVEGDCTVIITKPADKALTRARKLLVVCDDDLMNEFVVDYKKLQNCLSALNINFRAEDATKYTSKFITGISRDIMINNIDYVARTNGGYNKEILRGLRTLSLDAVEAASIEVEQNPIEKIMQIILDGEYVLASIYRDFTRTVCTDAAKNLEFTMSVIPLLGNPKLLPCVSGPISMGAFDGDGFLLDVNGGLFSFDAMAAVSSAQKCYTTGKIFIHRSGWVAFAPVSGSLLCTRLDDFIRYMDMEDFSNLTIIRIGWTDERSSVG